MKTRQELAVIRKKCDKDLLFFTRFFYKELRGTKFIVNHHHETIRDELHRIETYELELLNINIPPRFSKTELAAVNFIARGIGMNPSGNYLYITASDELRSQTSVSIRDIVTHPYFKIMYGVELKKDQNAKNLWRTQKGGGLKTATIFGQITGFGAGQMKKQEESDIETLKEYIRNFEGSIIIDDANKTDDSQIENATNDKVSRVFFNTILSRKNSSDTPIINIQQRAGLSDLTAQLQEHYGAYNEKVKFLVMPVVKNGTPLWEWKHNLEEIEELKNSPKTSHIFDTQYMQDPNPSKEVIFPKDELQRFVLSDINLEDVESVLTSTDVADEGNDYLSNPVGYLYGDKVYIVDWIYTKEGMKYTVPAIGSLLNNHKANYSVMESNNHGTAFIEGVSQYVSTSNIIPVFNTSNKHSRIVNQAMNIKLHFVFRSDVEEGSDYHLAMKHLCRYKKKKGDSIDDAPDSIALLSGLVRDLFQDRFI